MWSPEDNVSIGLALSKVFIIQSDTSFHSSDTRVNIADKDNPTGALVRDLPDGPSTSNAKRTMPKQISLGVAWFPSSSLLLSADFKYFTDKQRQ